MFNDNDKFNGFCQHGNNFTFSKHSTNEIWVAMPTSIWVMLGFVVGVENSEINENY